MIDTILSAETAAMALAAAQTLSTDQRTSLLAGTVITDDGSLELGEALEAAIGEHPRDYHVALALLAAGGRLADITTLYVFDVASSLPDLEMLDWMPALTDLTLSGYADRDLGDRPIKALCIAESPALTSLDGLRDLSQLKTLTLSYCPALTDGSTLHTLPVLERVILKGCARLDPSTLTGSYTLSVD